MFIPIIIITTTIIIFILITIYRDLAIVLKVPTQSKPRHTLTVLTNPPHLENIEKIYLKYIGKIPKMYLKYICREYRNAFLLFFLDKIENV